MTGINSINNISISGQTYGPLTQIVQNSTATLTQLNLLTQQASTGLVSQTFSGLGGSAAQTVLSVSPQISEANAQISAINSVTGALTTQQNALGDISSITSGFVGQLSAIGGSAATIIAAAQSALQEVTNLLNTQDGEDYVFGGQDRAEPPVPDAGSFTSSGFYSQIQSAVASLSANGATATTAAILGIASSNASGTTPFAAGLTASTGLPSVTLAGGEQVTTGIAANSNAFVKSSNTGTSSTGSYMRDILAGLTSIASLSPGQASGSAFSAFLQSVQGSLSSANTALNNDAGVLGNLQTELTVKSTSLTSTVTALTNQVSNADAVNTAATLSQLSSVQTALESSYQIIATLKSLNLANYL